MELDIRMSNPQTFHALWDVRIGAVLFSIILSPSLSCFPKKLVKGRRKE